MKTLQLKYPSQNITTHDQTDPRPGKKIHLSFFFLEIIFLSLYIILNYPDLQKYQVSPCARSFFL